MWTATVNIRAFTVCTSHPHDSLKANSSCQIPPLWKMRNSNDSMSTTGVFLIPVHTQVTWVYTHVHKCLHQVNSAWQLKFWPHCFMYAYMGKSCMTTKGLACFMHSSWLLYTDGFFSIDWKHVFHLTPILASLSPRLYPYCWESLGIRLHVHTDRGDLYFICHQVHNSCLHSYVLQSSRRCSYSVHTRFATRNITVTTVCESDHMLSSPLYHTTSDVKSWYQSLG